MSDKPTFFGKLQGDLSNLFDGSPASPASEAPQAPPQSDSPSPMTTSVTLTALDVVATIINFARKHCGATFQPNVQVENLYSIGPTPEQTGSHQVVEWIMSNRPGMALLIMPQSGSCSVTLAHGPNPPTQGGYMLGLSPVDSQTVPDNVGALRAQLEDYIKQGTIAWRGGKWYLNKATG